MCEFPNKLLFAMSQQTTIHLLSRARAFFYTQPYNKQVPCTNRNSGHVFPLTDILGMVCELQTHVKLEGVNFKCATFIIKAVFISIPKLVTLQIEIPIVSDS